MDTGGERIQLTRPGPDEHEGDEYWYAWSTRFSEDWQPPNDWLVILDWHSTYEEVCQPLQFELNHHNALSVQDLAGDVTGYDCFDGPGTARNETQVIVDRITPGVWNDFIVHVKWTTSAHGLVEVWHRLETDPEFSKVLTWRDVPTLQYRGDPADANVPYLLLAHYRDAGNRHTSVLYHDGFRMTDTAEKLAEDGLYTLPPSEIHSPSAPVPRVPRLRAHPRAGMVPGAAAGAPPGNRVLPDLAAAPFIFNSGLRISDGRPNRDGWGEAGVCWLQVSGLCQ
jgi:hypothetical protein